MNSTLVPSYVFFGGRCEEALGFYRTTLGARVDFLMRYNGSPEPDPHQHGNAVRAAFAMQEAVRATTQLRAARGDVTCRVRAACIAEKCFTGSSAHWIAWSLRLLATR